MLILLVVIALLLIGIAIYIGMARADLTRERLAAGVFDEKPEDVGLWRDAADLLQIDALQRLVERSPLVRRFAATLTRAEIALPLSKALLGMALIGLALAGLSYLIYPRAWMPLVGLFAAPLAAWGGLNAYAESRINKLDKLLPAFVTQMLTALRSGATPLSALQTASRSTPEPLGGSLRNLLDTIQIGIAPAQAWRDWASRTGSAQCHLLATGIRLKWEAGGQMSAMLEHVLESLQSRERMILRVRTLTAQAQLATYVLTALPLIFWLFTYYRNPRIFKFMVEDPIGVQALWVGFALLVLGFLWLRRIAKLEV
ncbi:MAG TPA: type II secretion system F family protein [Rhodocyclaceae bacterium]|jgi:tight adherence protein B|nr:type II secretion system F family protein [Rhodocyclaceae bacterium]HMV54564.1 type II secretion system F family protein [Rhodocyclaceae bacterium]HMZ83857.1 type II secretion system F family protein [Rhodocyclaceae bacterium]HNB78668.1 type II secretion system F family protein [Rhodocyclaceae bacterium]HNH14146.1 type II secretion system F family protein [Rhodocyclaceae bacterium]